MIKYLYLLILICNFIIAEPNWDEVRDKTVELFQQYLRIDTSNPPGDVTKAVKWLSKEFKKYNIPFETFTVDEDPRRMHILAEFLGSNLDLKPLLLLNHIDVVPADYSSWSVDPFKAEIIDDVIYIYCNLGLNT